MAILFHCPYCTASIKVPDSAAGKLGECPKCQTKIRIPTVDIPPPAPATAAPPVIAPIPIVAPPPAEPQGFDFSKLGAPSPRRDAPAPYAPKPQSRGSGGLVGILLALILIAIAGIGGWWVSQNQPVYSALATGIQVPSTQGIAVSVPWAAINVEQSRQPPVIEYFKKHQTSLLNDMLKIEIAASINGLEIRATPQVGHQLIGVSPLANEDLKQFILSREGEWETARQAVLAQYGKDLCDNVLNAQLKGTKVANISDYRDVVVLNSLVKGVGRHVLASGSDQKLYPCIHEDREGKLFFVVPLKLRDFTIVKKTAEGLPDVLPAGFRIDVGIASPAVGTSPIAPAEGPTAPAVEPMKTGEQPAQAEPSDKPAVSEEPAVPKNP